MLLGKLVELQLQLCPSPLGFMYHSNQSQQKCVGAAQSQGAVSSDAAGQRSADLQTCHEPGPPWLMPHAPWHLCAQAAHTTEKVEASHPQAQAPLLDQTSRGAQTAKQLITHTFCSHDAEDLICLSCMTLLQLGTSQAWSTNTVAEFFDK